MNLSAEEKVSGQDNFYEAMEVSRRDFLREVIGAGLVTGAGLGAMYFGYGKVEDPVRIGVIGTGDEGSVLIGAMNPEYVRVKAIADIRPYSIWRAFHGDWTSPAALAARPGLITRFNYTNEAEARKEIKVYDASNGGWEALIEDPEIEAIVIALPLHLHAPVAIAAMKAGKHVLTEKLMAHTIRDCKEMSRVSRETDLLLATGHQRHYSVLYDNAIHLIKWGLLGELQFIRAQWHRGNLPGADSWAQPVPGGKKIPGTSQMEDPIRDEIERIRKDLAGQGDPAKAAMLEKLLDQHLAWDQDKTVNAADHGYEERRLSGDYVRSALEELVRWRLWDRTGGGLMAELGSHQLDAASIFIAALAGEKVHPLTVHAVGGRHTFPLDRDAEDHVYCTFEFPAPGYPGVEDPMQAYGYYDAVTRHPDPKTGIPNFEQDPNKRIVVTYSSTMGNGYGGYGEVVMGSKGTLVLEREQDIMLYASGSTSRVKVKEGGGGPTMDTQASGGAGPVAKAAADLGPVSRGYTEEIEHFAYCLRNRSPENVPRCHPEVALGYAVIALTAKLAIKRSATNPQGGFVRFEPEWFKIESDRTPEEDLA